MKRSSILLLSLLLLLSPRGQAQNLSMEELVKGLREQSGVFETLAPEAGGKPKPFEIQLGDKVAKIGEEIFDGFRFRYPEDANGADFVWYFNCPKDWANWYILPVEGATDKPAFRDWLVADRFYRAPLDQQKERGRERFLQTLSGEYFTKGAEYILWFRRTKGDESGTARGVFAFAAKPEDKWDAVAIEKALNLEPAAAADQVAGLNSRGGLILLDTDFFDHAYAAERIDSVFTDIRATQRMKGGFFITMKQMIPPCTTRAPMDDILKKFGAPDFVRTTREEDLLSSDGKEKKDDGGESYTTYYYDHFGFQVAEKDKERKVARVLTQADDFSALAPPKDGSHYATLPMEHLTVFHRDGKEVGRAYYLLEGGDEPKIVTEPPAGKYLGPDGVLNSEGGGKWLMARLFPDGSPAMKIPMANNRFEGKGEIYYPSGKLRAIATYAHGLLNGESIEYDEDGKEKGRRQFKDSEEQ